MWSQRLILTTCSIHMICDIIRIIRAGWASSSPPPGWSRAAPRAGSRGAGRRRSSSRRRRIDSTRLRKLFCSDQTANMFVVNAEVVIMILLKILYRKNPTAITSLEQSAITNDMYYYYYHHYYNECQTNYLLSILLIAQSADKSAIKYSMLRCYSIA